ncbi:2-oxopent-4-enoate hydratase [Alteripontixanthobacter maritimus]|uniref:2-oxopent-4-enoate hydratase n=2 Tax=Alteripontixanthobacter maritimus TaxID=2161824 RepID=A0A369Q3S8_9SPHN|nr:2-oxopent-4-enoate hydratase [Alteripontixanthobacter maritimus]
MRALPGFPGELPATLDEAYDVQDASRAKWPDRVAGWKVGGVPRAFLSRFDAKWLCGPIFEQSVVQVDSNKRAQMPVFTSGFAAIEPEFVLRMGETGDDDRLFIGAEIASSPVPDINDYGPIAVICDFGNNRGLLIGDEITDWRDYDQPVRVDTVIDGRSVGTKELAKLQTGVATAREFLTDHAARRGFALPEGTYISCGAITGVHEALAGAQSAIDFGALGQLELELVPAADTR